MFAPSPRGTERAGTALGIVVLLIAILLVLSVSAMSYYLFSLQDDTDAMADARAFYAAEAARAAALARVVQHPGETSYESGACVLEDDRGASCAEYKFSIVDITLPMQNPRRRVRAYGYWPTEAAARATCRLTVYLELDGGTWTTLAYQTDD